MKLDQDVKKKADGHNVYQILKNETNSSTEESTNRIW